MNNPYSFKIFLIEVYYSLFLIATIIAFPLLIVFAIYKNLVNFTKNKTSNRSINGQVAVVTGSAGGLGRLIAIELASRGCHVAIVDVQYELAEKTALEIAKKYQVKAKPYKVDVSDYKQLQQLNLNVTHDLGDVTILINNAGILVHPSSLNNPTAEDIQKMINVNFTALCFSKQIFLPKMMALNQGYIVNIGSATALFPSHMLDIYAGTKAAVRSITASLRMEITSECKNITATTVMPVFLNTHQFVEGLAQVVGITKVFPAIEGPIVAQYVVDSMLNKEDEITIPNIVIYAYKLIELLPTSFKEIFPRLFPSKPAHDLFRSQRTNN